MMDILRELLLNRVKWLIQNKQAIRDTNRIILLLYVHGYNYYVK